ncbi:hypothetical protein LAC81_34755 (plasmid) [Ensifer adhaerens]|uniref:hypothetical protein n=1 Tax=Ensifer adhaerens TaxID=106592 RepID=UPI001CBECC8C|nr:hypothetical protein [Ensifer adhaerens]MBZ7927118.1 hypothetical protein [Ensifer adhaerens]UAX98161.1 hypothetical protein LAC78_36055 [Ensifer adhaerens]UAY05543.1 hypothetical protein LAC80_34760 [Ensifer adhaerens]UAY12921.1 hypothetical protein LAC81_34755 [Ensifer adhaerens]
MDFANPKTASVRNLLNLAAQYKDATIILGAASNSSHIPRRLLAFHSIELYLDALLLAKGIDQGTIGGFQRELGERMRIACESGLVLRKRTAAHLASLTPNGEQHIIRCAPERTATLSQINRVMATLEEVSQKVSKMLRTA